MKDRNYAKAVLFHGGLFDKARKDANRWGLKAQLDDAVTVDLAKFQVPLKKYAPAGCGQPSNTQRQCTWWRTMRNPIPFHRWLVVASVAVSALCFGQEFTPIQLPKPRMEGGKPLMQALRERQTTRTFSTKELPADVLSNLLWAAFGVNRPDSGRRTAPSANDRREIDIYVAMARGLYLYDANEHVLKPVLREDVRALTGSQDFVKVAPVDLIYVADNEKGRRESADDEIFYGAVDTGVIVQNVYLFCASEGLATVVRGGVPREKLAKRIGLRPAQRITVAQTVGYPEQR